MATKEELLIEANKRGLLTGEKKVAFDEAVKRGVIKLPQSAPAQEITYSPTDGMSTGELVAAGAGKFVSDVPLGAQQLHRDFGETVIGASQYEPEGLMKYIPAAHLIKYLPQVQLGAAASRALGYDDPEQAAALQAKVDEVKRRDAPLMDTTAGKVGYVGGALATGLVTPGGAGATGRAMVGGTLGAAQPVATGESRTVNAAVGAAAGAAIPPAIGWLTGKVGQGVKAAAAKVLGQKIQSGKQVPIFNADGTFTDDVIKELKASGTNPAELDDLIKAQLSKEGVLSPQEIERFNLFTRLGLNPTKAQVSQTADDFQVQQELVKRSNALRTQVEGQDMQLARSMEDFASKAGGATQDVVDTSESVFQAITKKATDLDDNIRTLYTQARNVAGPEKVVRFDELTNALKSSVGKNELSGGLVKAMASELRQRGLLGKGFTPSGRVDVKTAEEIRQVVNSFYEGANPQARRLIDIYKNALDDDVFKATGDDLFKQARSAKASFHSELNKTKLNRFDQNNSSMVEKILRNEIPPEKVFDRIVVSKSGRIDDLQKLKEYLLTGSEDQVAQGAQAFDNLRSQTAMYLLNQATRTVAKTEGGEAVFNGNQFRKALEQIGPKKLEILFGNDAQYLRDIAKAGILRIPVQGTQMGKGPSAQAISELGDRLPGIRQINAFARIIKDASQTSKAANPGKATENAMQKINDILRNPKLYDGTVERAVAPSALGASAGVETMRSQGQSSR